MISNGCTGKVKTFSGHTGGSGILLFFYASSSGNRFISLAAFFGILRHHDSSRSVS
jgi:hypothetical protein